ncbi:uncharacterized protein LOC122320586 [Drosophila ficusphila]|uniref:uncharacterized protein LOC122320586 n=1 Tax=Drosophila ficusphila TaxID=30025 RepID=UPI001C88FB30|nr:uncharacterized protein LOC122320586 [Drosophila ficusphila]
MLQDKPYTSYFWSDSQIVLHWLQEHSVTLSTFVGNRVSEIQDSTSTGEWKYVPTSLNPADIVSRGATTHELQASIWFSGPPFLSQHMSDWHQPPKLRNLDQEVVNSEKRKSTFTAVVRSNHLLERMKSISSYTGCLRVIAWMIRFYRLTGKTNNTKAAGLTSEELQHASNCIIWNLQQQSFSIEFPLLQKSRPLKGQLKFLNPFIESSSGFQLIRVGGRLENANISESEKHPILLPKKSHISWIYVRHLHLRNFHAGPKALVALSRLEFWIVNVRDLARRVVRSCVSCVRYKPKLQEQLMGSLPVERLSPQQPFSKCGVDFCGPINTYLRIRGKGPVKSYLAIFVCMASKAVHIRMIARRALPTDIYCDNATNFAGASVANRAPHFGGLWEAAVKSAKGLLNRTLMNTRLTFEELTTVAAEVEAILNSRPLTPLSPDPSDFGAITPGHLLVGKPLRALPERHVTTANITNLQRFDVVTAIKQEFWRRWSAEYINELRARTK